MAPLGPAPQMTKEWLRAHCRANKLYVTPSLNDTLHLHYQGFNRIENLEEYTGLKAVFLEGNGLESLDGLQVRQPCCPQRQTSVCHCLLTLLVPHHSAPVLHLPVRAWAALHLRAAELPAPHRAPGVAEAAGHSQRLL